MRASVLIFTKNAFSAANMRDIFNGDLNGTIAIYETFLAVSRKGYQFYRGGTSDRFNCLLYHLVNWPQILIPFGKHQMRGPVSLHQRLHFALPHPSGLAPEYRRFVWIHLHEIWFVTIINGNLDG